MTKLQQRLTTLREKCGLTQQELADQLEIPVRTLRTWEQGTREPLKLTAVGLEIRLTQIEAQVLTKTSASSSSHKRSSS